MESAQDTFSCPKLRRCECEIVLVTSLLMLTLAACSCMWPGTEFGPCFSNSMLLLYRTEVSLHFCLFARLQVFLIYRYLKTYSYSRIPYTLLYSIRQKFQGVRRLRQSPCGKRTTLCWKGLHESIIPGVVSTTSFMNQIQRPYTVKRCRTQVNWNNLSSDLLFFESMCSSCLLHSALSSGVQELLCW